MARAGDFPLRVLFSSNTYMESWAASNIFYARYINEMNERARREKGKKQSEDPLVREYVPGNIQTNAAIRSGVVNAGGYRELWDPEAPRNQLRASPNYAAKDTFLDPFGKRKREAPDMGLTLVAQTSKVGFPGQAFQMRRGKTGRFMPNKLSIFLMKRGVGGKSPQMTRARNLSGSSMGTMGWRSQLTQSSGSQKGKGGYGQSSIDTTGEKYMTKETAMGHNMYDTDEKLNEDNEFARSWNGFNELPRNADNPNYLTGLKNMYKEETDPSGYSKRTLSRAFYL